MKAVVKIKNTKTNNESVENYTFIEEGPQKLKALSDDFVRSGNISRWVDKNNREITLQEMLDLLNGPIDGVWIHLDEVSTLISKE